MSGSETIQSVNSRRGEPQIAQTLAEAFQDDPALAWIIPDGATRRKVLPRFFAIMAEQSTGTAQSLPMNREQPRRCGIRPAMSKTQ